THLGFFDAGCEPELSSINGDLQAENLATFAFESHCGGRKSSSDRTYDHDKQHTFFLFDVPPAFRGGSSESRDWITYYHSFRNTLGGITIQYWRFYPYNSGLSLNL